ncbi:MAG: rhodanese-like domain-containing protein [Polyangiaceae bacterium]
MTTFRRMTARRTLAISAATLGLSASFAGGLPTTTVELAPMTALDLAERIRDGESSLRVLDLRSTEAFDHGHVPTAEPAYREDALASGTPGAEDRDSNHVDSRPTEPSALAEDATIVVYAGDASEISAAMLPARVKEAHHLFFLRGGWAAWESDVMYPVLPDGASAAERADYARASDLSRYFGGTPRRGGTKLPPPSARPRGC